MSTECVTVFDACGETRTDDWTALGSGRGAPAKGVGDVSMLVRVGCKMDELL